MFLEELPMAFSPLSFAIGMGVAYVVPILTRSFRPLAVEAAAMGLGLAEDVRRIIAEQMENLEDIAAEARARREEILVGSTVDDTDIDEEDAPGADTDAVTDVPSNGTRARRPSRTRTRVRGD
jgi:hypothetical protein